MSQALTQLLPAQTANGADAYVVLGTIATIGGTNNFAKKATISAPTGYTTVTGVATNNVTISFGYRRAGAARVVIATQELVSGKNLVAGASLDIPVTLANKSTLQPGDVIDVLLDQNGTGVAVNVGLCATFEID